VSASAGGPIARGPVKRETDVLIVGGGIMGLALAYHLARRGVTDVVVVERSYLASGASGRNGGGIRMQWSTETNIKLMQESVELCKRFAGELGVNVWLRQGGYLFLISSEAERERMEINAALQNHYGVPTRMLMPEEARHIVPELDAGAFIAACFNPRDGILFPWPFLWGYANQAAALGVEIHTFTDVTAIAPGPSGFRVTTAKGEVRAQRVVDAAGAWSPEVARLVGVELPNRPHRHEILSTEPLKPFLGPMVSVLKSGLYFSQSMRGEIVTGITVEDVSTREVKLRSRLKFLTTLAKEITRVMPRLAAVRVLRQWAGPYDVTPDGNPIVGEVASVPGFYLACGFVGHGFMMAPVVSKYLGQWMAGGERHEFLHRWRLTRFAEGDVSAEDMIIG
jgi:heterotetrameric sarcosine oxidase beta subunit